MLRNKCRGKTVTVPQRCSVLGPAWLVAVRGQYGVGSAAVNGRPGGTGDSLHIYPALYLIAMGVMLQKTAK